MNTLMEGSPVKAGIALLVGCLTTLLVVAIGEMYGLLFASTSPLPASDQAIVGAIGYTYLSLCIVAFGVLVAACWFGTGRGGVFKGLGIAAMVLPVVIAIGAAVVFAFNSYGDPTNGGWYLASEVFIVAVLCFAAWKLREAPSARCAVQLVVGALSPLAVFGLVLIILAIVAVILIPIVLWMCKWAFVGSLVR